MAENKLNVGMLANVASDGNEGVSDQHVLTYVAANNSVEFKELSLSISGTGTVSSNADSVNTSTVSDINTVQDNVATTLTSLGTANTSIDTVESNLAAFATYANTNYASDAANSFATITVGEANVVASGTSNTLVFTSGNGISVTADAASQAITFDVNIGNVASEYYVLDGTANTVTLTKDNRPANTLYVTVGGLVQEPGINYITASTTLTLINTYPIINGTDVEVRYLPYTGEIAAPGEPEGWTSRGETYGYSVGGYTSPNANKQIQRFAFATDGNATDVGDLTTGRRAAAGASSDTHSYGAGGRVPSPGGVNTISKFAFANEATQSNLTTTLPKIVTQSSGAMSETHGFSIAGVMPVANRDIFRWSFSSDSESSTTHAQVGSDGIQYPLGLSGPEYGYAVSGQQPSSSPNNSPTNNSNLYPNENKAIEKFSYASENTINLHSKLDNLHGVGPSGSTSPTYGYVAGGKSIPGTGQVNFISKFPFAAEDVASDVGDLTSTRGHSTSAYNSVSGYAAGGSPSNSNTIDKYSFSADGNATDVGELAYDTYQAHGAHV
jgi:hypothetical protein